MSKEPKDKTDKQLENIVFKYDSSPADKKFFKQRIVDFLKTNPVKTYSQWMFEAVHERNGGMTLKYCHFNERIQKVYLDKYFYEWIVRTIKKAEKELEIINHR